MRGPYYRSLSAPRVLRLAAALCAVTTSVNPTEAQQPAAPRRTVFAAAAGDTSDALGTLLPDDVMSCLFMRGKHPMPPNYGEPELNEDGTFRRRTFDLKDELNHIRLGLYYMCGTETHDEIPPIADRIRNHDVLWTASPILKIENTLQIGFSGGAEGYLMVAFRDLLDERFYAALRSRSVEVVSIRGVETYRCEPERIHKWRIDPENNEPEEIRELLRHAREAPAGAGRPPIDLCAYIVPLAPNVVAILGSRKQAESVVGAIVDGKSYAARRPKWLTWDADTTFVGFQDFRRSTKESSPGILAAVDPNARGMLVRWSEKTPAQLQFTYITATIDPVGKFRDLLKDHEIYGRADLQPHPEGMAGGFVIGRILPNETKPVDAGEVCMYVYHLCGMIILP